MKTLRHHAIPACTAAAAAQRKEKETTTGCDNTQILVIKATFLQFKC